MNGGAPAYDRFAHWPRAAARAALAVIALLLILAMGTAPVAVTPALPGREAPVSALAQERQRDTDLQLYDRISERVAAGESYYSAAVEEQRAANFPVRPGIAVRLPTLAYFAAWIGTNRLIAVLGILALGTIWAWAVRLGQEPGGAGRWPAALALLAIGTLIALKPEYAVLHEVWAGILLALAFALHRPGKWHAAWLPIALALAIREHALPFVLLLGALAAWRRDWRETAAWGTLIALFGLGLWLHLAHVNALLLPGDRPSDSWLALRGLRGLTGNIVDSSVLQLLPPLVAAPLALLPLVGWAGWRSPAGLFGTLLFAGYGLLFMLAGRANNFYWALVVTPAWFVGYAFLPMALRSLAARAGPGRE